MPLPVRFSGSFLSLPISAAPNSSLNGFWLMTGVSCFLGGIGVLTKEFLDFSASRGNNLRSIGLEPGCKWCLCTARWKEAMDAAKGPDDPVVPKWVPLFFFNYFPPVGWIVSMSREKELTWVIFV